MARCGPISYTSTCPLAILNKHTLGAISRSRAPYRGSPCFVIHTEPRQCLYINASRPGKNRKCDWVNQPAPLDIRNWRRYSSVVEQPPAASSIGRAPHSGRSRPSTPSSRQDRFWRLDKPSSRIGAVLFCALRLAGSQAYL